jgi:iron complex transport system ATP-binding protein
MMLEVRELHFAYKKHKVLKGVDFSADKGECISLLGENGAGKTTLFRCVLGFLTGYQGEVLIDGVKAGKLSIKETAKRVAYIPQAHAPTFNYTVFETVLMGTNAHIETLRSPRAAERTIAEEMLELMNVEHLAERGYAEISGGERQLVLIARALAQNSPILVMDEPTANLDYGNQYRVMNRVRQLVEKGYLVIISTHNPEHALLYSDKILVMKDGVAELHSDPQTSLNSEVIKRLYNVDVELQTMKATWGEVPVLVPCYCRDKQQRERGHTRYQPPKM